MNLKIKLMSKSKPISWAMAGRCSMELVEQPSAISTVSAFRTASFVIISLAHIFLLNLLNTGCMTVTGRTIGENIAGAVNRNPEVIRPVDNPYSTTGGLAV